MSSIDVQDVIPAQTKRQGKSKAKTDNAQWCAAEEAELVLTLTDQKAMGNTSENGFKSAVWQLVVDQLKIMDAMHRKGPLKTASQVKSRFHRLKKQYKIVKALRLQSGFGWDEGRQMVTAPEEVWEVYIKVWRMIILHYHIVTMGM
ncbi:Myb/SANT-like DNA-binding domain-containing protein [Gautieria morchelliformis]|nr:Myb/SANT-like DNA-binding domain-containing protein [Gautieria morchelliformis]